MICHISLIINIAKDLPLPPNNMLYLPDLNRISHPLKLTKLALYYFAFIYLFLSFSIFTLLLFYFIYFFSFFIIQIHFLSDPSILHVYFILLFSILIFIVVHFIYSLAPVIIHYWSLIFQILGPCHYPI